MAFSAIVEEDPTNDGNFLYPFPEDIIFKELIPPFAFLDVVEYSNISHSDGKYENLSGSFSKNKSNVVTPTPAATLNSLLYLLFLKVMVE